MIIQLRSLSHGAQWVAISCWSCLKAPDFLWTDAAAGSTALQPRQWSRIFCVRVPRPLAPCVFLRLHRLRPEGLEVLDHLPRQHVSLLQLSESPQLHHHVVGLLAEHLDLPLIFRCLLRLPRQAGETRLHRRLVRRLPPRANPSSYISAEEWDNYFAGMDDVRGFAVGDDDARPKAPGVPARTVTMTPREPDTPPPGHVETAAGGRARTRSPRRPANTDGQWDYLNECDEAISQTLEWLSQDFVNFPVDRLRLWRDASGQTFEPELNLPIAYGRIDMWYWAVLRARYIGRVTPSAVPMSVPSHNHGNDLVVIDYTNLTWFLRGWREWRTDTATGYRYRLY